MGSIGILVLADAAPLYIEAGKAEHLLLKHREVLVRQLAHEHLLGETAIAGILRTVLDIRHTLVELFLRDIQGITELKGVQMVLGLIDHHHDIIGGLVIDKQFSVTIRYHTTGGIFYLLEKGIGVGILLIVVTHDLQDKKTNDIDDDNDNCHTADYITPIVNLMVFHPSLPATLSNVHISTKVNTALPTTHFNHSIQL